MQPLSGHAYSTQTQIPSSKTNLNQVGNLPALLLALTWQSVPTPRTVVISAANLKPDQDSHYSKSFYLKAFIIITA